MAAMREQFDRQHTVPPPPGAGGVVERYNGFECEFTLIVTCAHAPRYAQLVARSAEQQARRAAAERAGRALHAWPSAAAVKGAARRVFAGSTSRGP
jgi:hypothetical protein